MNILNHVCGWGALLVVVMLLSGCGASGRGPLNDNQKALFHVLESMGLEQVDEPYVDQLILGEDKSFEIPLKADQCYAIALITDGPISTVDVAVDESSQLVRGQIKTSGNHHVEELCTLEVSDLKITLKTNRQSAIYSFSIWEGSAAPSHIQVGDGSCDSPLRLKHNMLTTGHVKDETELQPLKCAKSEHNGHVYQLHVDRPSIVEIFLQASFQGNLRVPFDNNKKSLVVEGQQRHSSQNINSLYLKVDPGVYLVAVEIPSRVRDGSYGLIATVKEEPTKEDVCAQAASFVLENGMNRFVAEPTSVDLFTNSCSNPLPKPKSPDDMPVMPVLFTETLFKLDVDESSRILVNAKVEDGGTMFIRKECSQPQSEVACSSGNHIAAELEPGDYWVFVERPFEKKLGFMIDIQSMPVSQLPSSFESRKQVNPIPKIEEWVELNTIDKADNFSSSCGGKGASDGAFRFLLKERSRVFAAMERLSFNGVMYIQKEDGQTVREMACENRINDGDNSILLDVELEPGEYYLVGDGLTERDFGMTRLGMGIEDLTEKKQRCDVSPVLLNGLSATGQLSFRHRNFSPMGQNDYLGGDDVYMVEVTKPSTLDILLKADFPAFVYIRKECMNRKSQIAIAQIDDGKSSVKLASPVEPGVYYVVVDSPVLEYEGRYELMPHIEPRK